MHSDKCSDMDEVFFALCKTIDTPVSLSAWLRFKYSHRELVELDIHPRDYTSATAFHLDYSIVSFFAKYKGLNTGIDLEAAALLKFTKSEDSCGLTNRKFRNLAKVAKPLLHSILHASQIKIARVLGSFNLNAVTEKCGFGPGATFELPRRIAQIDRKICELPISVSRTAYPFFKAVIERDLHWSQSIIGCMPEGDFSLLPSVFVFQDACRIDTVPKNAKTHRIIAVEPRGNGYLQKGCGSYIRRRLRRVGIDLDDQSRNQSLARQALDLSLATLDLKGASDSVSKELVFSLLPYDWAVYLDSLRSRLAVMPDGTGVVLEKFSSMGNGFTFELETLIFWALAQSVTDLLNENGIVSVYGDDIIVTQAVAETLIDILKDCGFEINSEKSFLQGPFFESCGKHFFDGQDVTPAYQKEVVDSPLGAMRTSNRLIRLAFRVNQEKSLCKLFQPAWESSRRMFKFLEPYAIPFGSEGDDGFLHPYRSFPFSKRHFSSDSQKRSFGSGMGLKCRVLKEELLSIPAIDSALLAVAMKRSNDHLRDPFVLDDVPVSYAGMIDIVPKRPRLASSNRWVIPIGKFSANWT